MKVLHVCFGFPPDPVGGTEVYVEGLCEALHAAGIRSVVAAPAPRDSSYVRGGIEVRRFATTPSLVDLDALYGDGDPVAAESFARVLDAERPDLLHQHALTPACSTRLAQLARDRGVPVVFTYHTPATSCARGTLIERGETVCDGRLDVARCTTCVLDEHGVPASAAKLLARVPQIATDVVRRSAMKGRGATALRMRDLIARRQHAFRRLVDVVDCFVAPAEWVAEVLRANGVGSDRIVRSAQGLSAPPERAAPLAPSDRLRIVHLGRLDPAKGTALLLRALRAAPELPVDLDVFGISQARAGEAYAETLQSMAGDDTRIRLRSPVNHSLVVETMARYDVVAVPSQTLETGPLVVLEAQAAGVPVLGSATGGMAERIRDGVDGVLVSPFSSVSAWTAALRRCATERDLIARLRRGVRPPRSMSAAASDMTALYASIVARPVEAASNG